jgi:hypothetical protein
LAFDITVALLTTESLHTNLRPRTVPASDRTRLAATVTALYSAADGATEISRTKMLTSSNHRSSFSTAESDRSITTRSHETILGYTRLLDKCLLADYLTRIHLSFVPYIPFCSYTRNIAHIRTQASHHFHSQIYPIIQIHSFYIHFQITKARHHGSRCESSSGATKSPTHPDVKLTYIGRWSDQLYKLHGGEPEAMSLCY